MSNSAFKDKKKGAARTKAVAAHSDESYVSVVTAANHFELSTRTIQRMMSRGEIPVIQIGRSVRVRISDIENAALKVPALG